MPVLGDTVYVIHQNDLPINNEAYTDFYRAQKALDLVKDNIQEIKDLMADPVTINPSQNEIALLPIA